MKTRILRRYGLPLLRAATLAAGMGPLLLPRVAQAAPADSTIPPWMLVADAALPGDNADGADSVILLAQTHCASRGDSHRRSRAVGHRG